MASLTQPTAPSSSPLGMTDTRYDALAGLRKQIVDNCLFFTCRSSARMSVVVTHEAIGTYRAIAVADYGGRSEVVLSSDSFNAMVKAFEHLMTKSADAVEQNISSTGFGRFTSTVDHDNADNDDDGSSVSSYVDELDKDGLADSSLSLESEVESAYESASEDDHYEDGIRYAGSRHSPSRKPIDCHGTGRQPRYLAHNNPVHRRRRNPPRAAPPSQVSKINGNGCQPGVPLPKFPAPAPEGWPQVLPRQQMGPNGSWPQSDSTPSGFGFINVDNRTCNPAPQRAPLPPPGAVLPMRAPPSQYFPPHGSCPPTNEWAARAGRPPAQQQQQPPPSQQNPPMKSICQGRANVPPVMPIPPPLGMQMRLPPIGSGPSPRALVPSSTSQASSSSSSTPTLTPNPNNPSEYNLPPPPPPPGPTSAPCLPSPETQQRPNLLPRALQAPAAIDYRVSILSGPCGGREHRILARTPPMRSNIRQAAMRYIFANPAAFRSTGPSGPGPLPVLRAEVTRAVFVVAGREESYDLAAYPENDLSRLCESMAGAAGWPLFEVTLPHIPAASDVEIVDD